jgi:DNA repair exonuclease SbcCD ATPase subunit
MGAICEKGLLELDKLIDRKKAKREEAQTELSDLNQQMKELNTDNLDKAAIWMKALATNQKVSASQELSKLGTTALQYGFGPKYEMQVEMAGTSKKPETNVWVVKNKKYDEREDPIDDNGGGVVDIMGTAMRIVTLDNYTEPVLDGPIIFDEPFKHVSTEYVPAMSEFTYNVSRDFGRQVIAVTHTDYLSAMTDSNIYVCLDENERSIIEVRKNDVSLRG